MTKLYLPRGNLNWAGHNPVFACRNCYHLPYASQYESKRDRMWRQLFEWRYDTGGRTDQQYERLSTTLLPFLDGETARAQSRLERMQVKPRRLGRPSPKRPPGRPREKRLYHRRRPLVLSERREDQMQAYCPKCRDRRKLVDAKPITFSNGRLAL